MRTIRLAAALAATFFIAGQANAEAIQILPEGTAISADPATLLGFDASLNDYFAGGSSAVDDLNIEFLTDDFALAIDFGSDGLLRLWDNLGTGDDLFNYTLRFTLAGAGLAPLQNIQQTDVSGLAGGDLLFSIIDSGTIELALRDVKFAPGFSHTDFSISVDEPPTMPLLAGGLLIALAFVSRRRSFAARNTAFAS